MTYLFTFAIGNTSIIYDYRVIKYMYSKNYWSQIE
jgi:hypothetical protein